MHYSYCVNAITDSPILRKSVVIIQFFVRLFIILMIMLVCWIYFLIALLYKIRTIPNNCMDYANLTVLNYPLRYATPMNRQLQQLA